MKCHRCGRAIADGVRSHHVLVQQEDGFTYSDGNLCFVCTVEFNAWMHAKTTTVFCCKRENETALGGEDEGEGIETPIYKKSPAEIEQLRKDIVHMIGLPDDSLSYKRIGRLLWRLLNIVDDHCGKVE